MEVTTVSLRKGDTGVAGFVGHEVGKGKSISGLGLRGSFFGLSSAFTVSGKNCLCQQLFVSIRSFLANVCQTEMFSPFVIAQRNPTYSLNLKDREIDVPPPWKRYKVKVQGWSVESGIEVETQ